jgi:CubicO group peptidase (beta-lactamase class C family)
VSTIADFHCFADMLRHGGERAGTRLLATSSVTSMTTNHGTAEQLRRGGPSSDGSTGWGLGVGVQITSGGPMSVGAYGWDGGLGSIWRNDPERDVIAILLTNQTWTSPSPPPVAVSFLESVHRL